MYYKKTGLPEEDELVVCTVTNVQYNSVFCRLDEYGQSGMIHISEVSPGRIRNIRDYVQEGKKVVCKILRINRERGHIDLSLRRVTENQRREKNAAIKQEQKAEKLLEYYAKEHKIDPKKLYEEVGGPILKEYEYIHEAFEDVVADEADLAKLGVPKVHADKLTTLIKEKIPPKRVTIVGTLSLTTYDEKGVEKVKKALVAAQETEKKNITINYLGNARYRVTVEADDYEQAEEIVKKATAAVDDVMSGPTDNVEFSRED